MNGCDPNLKMLVEMWFDLLSPREKEQVMTGVGAEWSELCYEKKYSLFKQHYDL